MVSVIFPAAGQGKRMQAGINKVLLTLGGEPILTRTLKTFSAVEEVGELIVVVAADEVTAVERQLQKVAGLKPYQEVQILGKFHIVREGYVFIFGALAVAVFLGLLLGPLGAVVPVILAAYFTYFFRNPDRVIPADEDLIVSPADGTVQDVVDVEYDDFLKGPGTKVIIFLSIFSVHVNRSPIAGEIKTQKYVCGRFKPAYKDEVGFENERHMIGIENDRLKVTVTQIAGILARRIVSWVTLDDKMEKGDVYGLIKFASCTEIVVPKNVEVLMKKGDKVHGGETIVGRIKD